MVAAESGPETVMVALALELGVLGVPEVEVAAGLVEAEVGTLRRGQASSKCFSPQ